MSWYKGAIAGLAGLVTLWLLTRSSSAASSNLAPSVPAGPLMDAGKAKSLTPDWTDEDYRTLVEIAQRNKINPADLWLVIVSESGGKPWAVNRRADGFANAVGLIQITQSASGTAGITEEQRLSVPSWSVTMQLPLVDKFFSKLPWTRAGREYTHAGLVYEGVFAPGIMLLRGTSPDTVLYTKGKDGDAYKFNSGFDKANKGTITVGDLIEHVRPLVSQSTYRAGLQRLREVMGDPSVSPGLPSQS